ncbi:MAG: isoleucine--tRNA ligase [Gemmatimonadaceae bacterium]|nr:isoleucine--tRNA ligase [Gemmatimonadaceae bacterium]
MTATVPSTFDANGVRGPYPLLPPERAADALERELVAQWRDEQLYEQVQAAREGAEPWVFYDGPPTANGKPGIHHVFARAIKDLFCRHRVMRGHYVSRRAGWDTHGLPVEIEVEKQIAREKMARDGLTAEQVAAIGGKKLIEEVGIAEFNRRCRESVFTYKAEWEALMERIGHAMDYQQAYVTYTNEYVESVWWSLRTLFDRGMLHRGHKVVPFCPRCGTALSSHEVALGYQDVSDPSVYVALDLAGDAAAPAAAAGLRRRILVWTTTPWTLVSNVALAVNPELTYVEVRKKSGQPWTLTLAEARAAAVLGDDWSSRWDVLQTVTGDALVGQRYVRPLDWVPYPDEGAHEVIVGESFVSADDGSGVVHMAPAFGADDYAAGQRHGLAFLQPVTQRGEFDASIPLVGGRFVKAVDQEILGELERRDVLWKASTFVHAYPHCWRCGTPLLYYARSSWFIRTTSVKDDLVARNAAIAWHPPEVGAGRFGEWLSNNVDWAISRDRYWGTPLPLWVNDADPTEVQAIGSFAELAAASGRALPPNFDPHRPFIDDYTWPAPSGTGTMRRTSEVIDVWYDSGAMPFAQWHYPFTHPERLAQHYPADFIAEGVDQTRGWFYSLLAIATALGDALPRNGRAGEAVAAPYRHVVVNDLVLDAKGQKMSKSKGNTVDPWAVIERHGIDAVRLFLVGSSQVWVPRRFDEAAIRDTAGRFLVTLKNIYHGIFAQYANFGWSPSALDPAVAARPPLDRWILSRLSETEQAVDALLGDYDATLAVKRLIDFVDGDLSKWYVRLSRARFYEVDGADHRAAFATLHECLTVTSRLLAPFAPFVSDWLHRALMGTSVHLASFVRPAATRYREPALDAAMDEVRTLCTLAHAARDVADVKVRQPLALLRCVVPDEHSGAAALGGLIAAELNVKAVEFLGSGDALVTLEGKGNFRTLGKAFGKATPQVAALVPTLDQGALRELAAGREVRLATPGLGPDWPEVLLTPEQVTIIRRASGDAIVQESGGYVVALDPTITPALWREGAAREVVSRVQRLRRETGLDVSDRITLDIRGGATIETAARERRDWIAGEVLATAVRIGADEGADEAGTASVPGSTGSATASLDDNAMHLLIRKAGPDDGDR